MLYSQNAIWVENLERTFNGKVAVRNLSFAVEPGEIFGFLGPNGAGKTTTIRMLTGQLTPTGGQARVAGYDIVQQRNGLKPCIGVVFEYQNLYERMSGYDNLIFFAKLYQVDPKRVDQVLEEVRLTDRRKDAVRTYSNGMKQRLVIARALLHQPHVLFLDEPTRGLDPVVGREIRNLVARLAREGMTVFLTTHYMEEADLLCGRVAFLDQGSIVALDTPVRLKQLVSRDRRHLTVMLDSGAQVTLHLSDPGDAQRLSQWVQANRVAGISSDEATLEDVFIQLTGRSLVQ